MASSNRDQLVKPEFMSEQEFQWVKQATESLERIRGDARADAAAYQANPDGWAEGRSSRSGMPTLLLTTIGRKSGEKREYSKSNDNHSRRFEKERSIF